MGFARFYLAVCVLLMHADHLHDLPLPRGRHAVQLFFVISGFYMAMILSGRYATLRNFYASRWARISTPYYVHFAIFVVLSLLVGAFSGQFLALQAYFSDPLSKNGLSGILAAAATNFTIFGQDAVLFFRDNVGEGMQFTSRFAAHPDPLWKYLVIPQCWTVSIELFFYVLVPFLNRWKSLPLLLLCLGTFAFRIYAYEGLGLRHDPWLNRFFPFELGLFVVGMLSWRMHEFVNFSWIPKNLPALAYGCLVLLLLFLGSAFFWIYQAGVASGIAEYVVLGMLCVSGPLFAFVFLLTKHHSLDRIVGELSYPIYLNHLFFIVLFAAFPVAQILPGGVTGNSLVVSVVSAWAFWFFLGRKLDDRRHSKFLGSSAVRDQ